MLPIGIGDSGDVDRSSLCESAFFLSKRDVLPLKEIANQGIDRLRRRLAYRRATDRLEMKMTAEFSDKMRRPLVKPTTFDLCELLFTKILLLPELQQEVVQLTFFKGLSQREIAAQKSISLGTVKTRLQLARKKLLNQLLPIQNRI